MAGGGKVRIIDRDNSDSDHTAKVTDGRLWVNTGGGGGATGDVNLVSIGGVPVTTPLAISGTVTVGNFPATVAVTQSTSPWVVSGAVTVGGTVAVTQSTSPWVVSGTVTAVQATHDNLNLNATIQVEDVDVSTLNPLPAVVLGVTPGTTATSLGKAEDALHVSGHVGVMSLAVRNDAQTPLAGDGDYIPLMVDASGALKIVGSIGGSVAITSIIPGTAPANLGKAEDALHASGDTGVATWAVRQDTASALSGNGDYIPHTTDALGNLRVGGASTSGLGKAEDAAHASGDVGVMALAVRRDVILPALAADGDYIPLITDPGGSLRVNATEVGTITPGTASTSLGKAEDFAHTTSDTGVMALAVRRDALVAGTSSPGSDNDYATFNVDSVGALWVRNKGDTVTTLPFSGSTRGRPVQIVATATAGTLIHTATTTAGQIDKMFLDLTNTTTTAITVTIEFGTSGVANNINVIVPAKETVTVLNGVVIGGAATDEIRAFASTASVVNAVGRVERLVA